MKLELWILLCSLWISIIVGTGTIKVTLFEYWNPSALKYDGACCDGSIPGCPLDQCDHHFDICLTDNSSDTGCINGLQSVTGPDNKNEIHFPSISSSTSVVNFKFENWLGSVLVKINVTDVDSDGSQLVDYFALNHSEIAGYNSSITNPVVYNISGTRKKIPTRILLGIAVYCDQHYYGPQCANKCIGQNDCAGHYVCDEQGHKKCSPGWDGINCTIQISGGEADCSIYEDQREFIPSKWTGNYNCPLQATVSLTLNVNKSENRIEVAGNLMFLTFNLPFYGTYASVAKFLTVHTTGNMISINTKNYSSVEVNLFLKDSICMHGSIVFLGTMQMTCAVFLNRQAVYFDGCNLHGICIRYGPSKDQYFCCCNDGFIGQHCEEICRNCGDDGSRNISNGSSLECLPGRWGHVCENKCTNCLTGTGCGTSNGICIMGCLTGLYGMNCNEQCGYCAGDRSCNRSNGACNQGCQPGWQEEYCTSGLQQENIPIKSSSALPIGVQVGVALGAVGLSIIIIIVAVIVWKRRKGVPETSQIESTYEQIDTIRVRPDISAEYSKIEELGLPSLTQKESSYENTVSASKRIPKREFRDHYEHFISLDERTGEPKLLSVFNNIEHRDQTKAKVKLGSRRTDDSIEKSNRSYLFEVTGNKEFTILSDFPTTSEALWRIVFERKIHLIMIVGENSIHFKPKAEVDIGLIQIECVDITLESDYLLCNLNVAAFEKETKVRNVQVLLSPEECSFWISSDINKTVAVLRRRLRMREGIEVFNTLINCTPDTKNGECFVATLMMIDFMEKSGYIDIIGIIEAMRNEKNDIIDTFDMFKFCHDVILKWIVDEDK